MWSNGFEGWYFKHQTKEDVLALIPGRARSGAFIQMIDKDGSRQFPIASLSVQNGVIRADQCVFSARGVVLNLPEIQGQIAYRALTPLQSDIMGPFRFFPMECRHGIISMSHRLSGALTINGRERRFDDGTGYIEKDSGVSFPSAYLWLQCNDFELPCALMVSIAEIPFGLARFRGCICAIVYNGKEYRLATYKNVHIHAASQDHVCLSQGNLLLEIDVQAASKGHALRSPANGQMSKTIHETNQAFIRCRFFEGGQQIFDLQSQNAGFEYQYS